MKRIRLNKNIKKQIEISKHNMKMIGDRMKKARKANKYLEWIFLHYYSLELSLRSWIRFKMIQINMENILEGKKEYYSNGFVQAISEEWNMKRLIDLFCLLYGDELKKELNQIREARNYLQHRIFKKKLNERTFNKCLKDYIDKIFKPMLKFSDFVAEISESIPKEIDRMQKYDRF